MDNDHRLHNDVRQFIDLNSPTEGCDPIFDMMSAKIPTSIAITRHYYATYITCDSQYINIYIVDENNMIIDRLIYQNDDICDYMKVFPIVHTEVSPNGKYIAFLVAGILHIVKIDRPDKMQIISEFDTIANFKFTPDGKFIMGITYFGKIIYWCFIEEDATILLMIDADQSMGHDFCVKNKTITPPDSWPDNLTRIEISPDCQQIIVETASSDCFLYKVPVYDMNDMYNASDIDFLAKNFESGQDSSENLTLIKHWSNCDHVYFWIDGYISFVIGKEIAFWDHELNFIKNRCIPIYQILVNMEEKVYVVCFKDGILIYDDKKCTNHYVITELGSISILPNGEISSYRDNLLSFYNFQTGKFTRTISVENLVASCYYSYWVSN